MLYCFTNNEVFIVSNTQSFHTLKQFLQVRSVLNSAWSRRRLSHSFLGGNPSASSLGHNSLLSKHRRRQSVGSNSFNSLIGHNTNNINNNNNHNTTPNVVHLNNNHLASPNGNQNALLNKSTFGDNKYSEDISAGDRPTKILTVDVPIIQSLSRNANSFPANFPQASITDL